MKQQLAQEVKSSLIIANHKDGETAVWIHIYIYISSQRRSPYDWTMEQPLWNILAGCKSIAKRDPSNISGDSVLLILSCHLRYWDTNTISLKPVLNKTSRSVHEASQCFKKIGQTLQTYFANSLKLCSFRLGKESSGTLFNSSGCVWLAGLDFCATLTSRHWASDQLTVAHFAAPFLSHLAALIIWYQVWM